jgi:3-oxoacyl-[acyl-carrier-protein] synthase-3
MQERRSRILGLGGYIPPRVVTNQDMTQWMDTTNEWIVERTGIEERHWIDPGESGAGMAAKACKEALDQASFDPKDVDMLIYATLSPDHMFPGTGVFTQRALGLKEGCAVLDIRQQCTGFIYGVSIADNFIRSGMFRHILVVGSEIHSTGLDVTTNGRDVAVLFGDGAGAVLIGPSEGPEHQILSTHLHADGTDAEILWVEKPGSKDKPMISHEDIDAGRMYPKMVGKKVFKHAVTRMPQAIMEGMIANQLKLEDIDLVIPHQANLRINEMVGKMIGLPPEKMHNNIQKVGNTTAASIPLCLKDAIAQGKVKSGDLLCLVAFGAGLTWGSVFVRL